MTRGSQLLQEALRARGLSQRKATAELGLSEGLMTRWCKGDRLPNRDSANKLEEAYGIPARSWSEPAVEPATGTEG